MESPWGSIPVSDCHVHFFSHHFFSLVASQKAGLTVESMAQTLGWQTPPESAAELAGLWAHELDRHGVDRATLIASVPGDEDSVAAAVEAFPNRFYGYAMVNPLQPDIIPRLQGALDRGRLHGVCLFPAMHRFSMHDEAALAILDVIAATRPFTLVFVHCGALTVGFRTRLGLPSLFDMRYSNPADLHAVALRYPQIRFVIPHFGAGYFREALMVADQCPNVYLDTSSSNRWMHYEPAGVDLRNTFRRALELLGPDRLLFGTDSSFFPRGWHAQIFEAQSKVLYELAVSREAAQKIMSDNLVRLLGANH